MAALELPISIPELAGIKDQLNTLIAQGKKIMSQQDDTITALQGLKTAIDGYTANVASYVAQTLAAIQNNDPDKAQQILNTIADETVEVQTASSQLPASS